MARSSTRKTKKEVRWDAHTGGIVPEVRFSKSTITALNAISEDERFIPILESHCGYFLLEQSLEDNKPTSGDYEETLGDLFSVTRNFLDRLACLRGHELEALIDSSWYEATKTIPDNDALQETAATFLKQIMLAQRSFTTAQGRTNTSAPLRDFARNCREALMACGLSEVEAAEKTRVVARICINEMGKSHLIDRLRHYC